jgi:hypothetical protein
MEKTITYCGIQAKVGCDEKCNKAWGITLRPKEQLSDDFEDVVYLSDDELGDAPKYPKCWEGGDGKPTCDEEKMNKWCIRQCERCVMTEYGRQDETLVYKDWCVRRYNIPWLHKNDN